MTLQNLIPLFSFMVLCMAHLSEEGCRDEFDVKKPDSDKDFVSFVKPKDLSRPTQDALNCTAEALCYSKQSNSQICSILKYCFHVKVNKKYEECQNSTSINMTFYHLRCLLASEINVSLPECEYVNSCEMYLKSPAAPTTASTVTAATTATTATSAEAMSTSPPVTKMNLTSLPSSGCDASGEFSQIFFQISLILNTIGLIGVTIGMIVYCNRHRVLPNRTRAETNDSSDASSENHEMMSNTELHNHTSTLQEV